MAPVPGGIGMPGGLPIAPAGGIPGGLPIAPPGGLPITPIGITGELPNTPPGGLPIAPPGTPDTPPGNPPGGLPIAPPGGIPGPGGMPGPPGRWADASCNVNATAAKAAIITSSQRTWERMGYVMVLDAPRCLELRFSKSSDHAPAMQ